MILSECPQFTTRRQGDPNLLVYLIIREIIGVGGGGLGG